MKLKGITRTVRIFALVPLCASLGLAAFDDLIAVTVGTQHRHKYHSALLPKKASGLRSPHRPLSATEDGDQSRRMPYLSEAWKPRHRKAANGVADAMIKASLSME